MFPANMFLQLLEESDGVPILVSIVSLTSYNVMLEEVSDANLVCSWDNPFAIENPLDFDLPCTVDEQLTKFNESKRRKPEPSQDLNLATDTKVTFESRVSNDTSGPVDTMNCNNNGIDDNAGQELNDLGFNNNGNTVDVYEESLQFEELLSNEETKTLNEINNQ